MPTFARNSHCSYCGAAYAAEQAWPRTCATCGNTSFTNPLPVAVVLLPVGAGVLTIRREIEPRRGMLAMPGGYVNVGESWQTAAARELFEETGITIDAAGIRDFRTSSAPDGTLLVFGLAAPLASLPDFVASDETSEMVVLTKPEELAFSTHTQVLREYFERVTT